MRINLDNPDNLLDNLGETFDHIGTFFQAFENYLKTLNDTLTEPGIEIYFELAELYQLLANVKSLFLINEKFREAIESFTEGNSSDSLRRSLGNDVGQNYVELFAEAYDKSFMYAKELIDVIKAVEDKIQIQMGEDLINLFSSFI